MEATTLLQSHEELQRARPTPATQNTAFINQSSYVDMAYHNQVDSRSTMDISGGFLDDGLHSMAHGVQDLQGAQYPPDVQYLQGAQYPPDVQYLQGAQYPPDVQCLQGAQYPQEVQNGVVPQFTEGFQVGMIPQFQLGGHVETPSYFPTFTTSPFPYSMVQPSSVSFLTSPESMCSPTSYESFTTSRNSRGASEDTYTSYAASHGAIGNYHSSSIPSMELQSATWPVENGNLADAEFMNNSTSNEWTYENEFATFIPHEQNTTMQLLPDVPLQPGPSLGGAGINTVPLQMEPMSDGCPFDTMPEFAEYDMYRTLNPQL